MQACFIPLVNNTTPAVLELLELFRIIRNKSEPKPNRQRSDGEQQLKTENWKGFYYLGQVKRRLSRVGDLLGVGSVVDVGEGGVRKRVTQPVAAAGCVNVVMDGR